MRVYDTIKVKSSSPPSQQSSVNYLYCVINPRKFSFLERKEELKMEEVLHKLQMLDKFSPRKSVTFHTVCKCIPKRTFENGTIFPH